MDDDLQDLYDEMLDECYDSIEIAGIVFTASEILKKADPIAYQCGLNDFESEIVIVEEDENQ